MGETFDGFDIDKVTALRKDVAGLETSAITISASISNVAYQAQGLLTTGLGVPPQLTRANPHHSSDSDPDRMGLTTVAKESPGVAAEMQRRLAHLLACEKIVYDGIPIDPDIVFSDTPPPDEKTIKDALDSITGNLEHWYGSGVAEKLATTLTGLNAAELDAVIGQLDDADLARLGSAVSVSRKIIYGHDWGITNDLRIKLANALLTSLGTNQLARVSSFPALRPSTGVDADVPGHIDWTPVTAGLYGSSGKPSIDDIQQGYAGDCWFLAAIGAELEKNPDFVNKHIRTNANGTYTVTLYQDGKPVEVTVDNTVPTHNHGQAVFAHPAGEWDSFSPAWIEIYEKAYTQLEGSYHAIEGGWAARE